ncbi:deoxyuridine 5'-triphosphate nucleotidohydrolase, mitochondrial isoform X2 [Lutra lutra]|uniref:deoxyuridine 5'-triphosphate nucleotidohydrolase, mitochondrial isoform X4 n=1 Tax=Mustela erminea TaxID=36723 RepID=UPI001386DC3B|nr:deoxyuridine 5'-triphosphate nucleotidohydrolase, mitochondrial isoform X4 [Mustela erminea]XP_032712450.1 deoxyuridine 5'-triphosphate nucleotidohydrolase, mitochondrial isoform X2 [Lontra canadensis]XP_047593018.1 deoxyuridine 5'-triphosphate nucleotidohydrolase, mitochondrial isoform X2 [Lutra lutra]
MAATGAAPATPATSPSKRPRPAEDSMRLRFVRLSEHATAPTKGSARAAGYDLYSAYDYTLPPMEKALVKTDIQVALPSGCYGRVAPRSGLAAKHFIDVGAGVIDEDYRGNVGVVLFNFGKEKFEVKKGDRIAQLICERIFYPEIEEVQVLDDTERGSGGFGSTGKN